MTWGRLISRWGDAEEKYYVRYPEKIFDEKLAKVLACQNIWPAFVLYEEDACLGKEKWDKKYIGVRALIWDNTDIPFVFKPSTAMNQRITYSSYYNNNCGKGGFLEQLCGWLCTANLWVGATSNSFYQKETKLFHKQKLFAEQDLLQGKYVPFTNIFDKGYRLILAAWKEGKQNVIQPVFAKSDRKFTGLETITSASVASDRGGNKRGVNVCKRSGFLQRGLRPKACPIRLDNVWLTWSFTTNFMYEPVL